MPGRSPHIAGSPSTYLRAGNLRGASPPPTNTTSALRHAQSRRRRPRSPPPDRRSRHQGGSIPMSTSGSIPVSAKGETLEQYGHCVIAASEGIKDRNGQFLSAGSEDVFGHAQLGGIVPLLANRISAKLGCKCHWATPDYLQRSACHIASETDVEQAYAVGRAAVEFAIAGRSAVMPAIRRLSDSPYCWDI